MNRIIKGKKWIRATNSQTNFMAPINSIPTNK